MCRYRLNNGPTTNTLVAASSRRSRFCWCRATYSACPRDTKQQLKSKRLSGILSRLPTIRRPGQQPLARRREERNVVICQSICIGKPELLQKRDTRGVCFLSILGSRLSFGSTNLAYESFIFFLSPICLSPIFSFFICIICCDRRNANESHDFYILSKSI
jgi:hypothetical protein